MSLITEGFTLLGTIKVPSLGVGVTSSNTPLLIKAADLTTAMKASLKADWGDLRLSSDAGGLTQYPIEIVDTDLAWTRLTSVAADVLVRVWGNKPAAVKEIDTATYGRDAVYVNSTTHQGGSSALTDVTGNATITNVGSAPLDSVSNFAARDIQGDTTRYLEASGTSEDYTGDFSAGAWMNLNSTSPSFAQVIGIRSPTASTWEWSLRLLGSDFGLLIGSGGLTGGTTLVINTDYKLDVTISGTTATFYLNGAFLSSSTISGARTNYSDTLKIGSYRTGLTGATVDGSIGRAYADNGVVKTADQISIEYQNQSAVGAWWIAEDAGGSVTVIGATPNYSYSAISGMIDLTPEITVTGATPDYAYAAITGTIELTPQITVTGTTPNYTYSAIQGTVQTVGIINITGTTPNYVYAAVTGSVALQGTITVTGDTPNYSYTALRGVIQFGENVYTNSFVGFAPDITAFNGVVKSSSFNGIISDTSDFSGIVKSTTFLGVKQ